MDRNIIQEKLDKLPEHPKPTFGKMTPQHMVEHLTLTVKIAYKIKWPEFEASEKQLAQKEMLLNTSMDFPKGLTAPGSEGGFLPLKYPNLAVAKENLLKSIDEYNTFFNSNPEARTIHPRLSWLVYPEWEKFHLKHFRHHFGQFGIW